MRVAAVSWAIRPVSSQDEFLDHMSGLVKGAVLEGANVVVLPESIDLERCSLAPDVFGRDIPRFLAPGFELALGRARQLADHHNITLVAGTHLRETEHGFVNSAVVAWPGGTVIADKNKLTQWEKQDWGLTPGSGLWSRDGIGLATCYDIEFPGCARALAECGAGLIAVPAYTEFERGFHRVRWCCHARTVECQLYVAHASLMGGLGQEPVASTFGTSAVLCPSLTGFPDGGILAETSPNQEGMAVAEIDLDGLDRARASDDVRNWADRDSGDWTVVR